MSRQECGLNPDTPPAMTGPVLGRGYSRRDWQALAAVVLLGLLLRGVLCTRLACISRDGVHFVTFAKQLADDPVPTMKTTTKQPGFSWLLLGVHGAVGRFVGADSPLAWQRCGQALAFVGGVGICALVFVLTRRLFDTAAASVAGVLAAVWPQAAHLSADVLSDMPHLALYLLAMMCAYRALRAERIRWFALCGVIAGLAYWLRQEGLGIVAAAAICWVWPWRRRRWPRQLAGVSVLAFSFIVIIAPYSLAIGKLMPNKNLWELFFGTPQQEITTETRRDGEEEDEGRRMKDEAVFLSAGGGEVESGFISHSSSSRLFSVSPCLRGETLAEMIPWWMAPPRMVEAWAKGGRYVLSTLFLLALVLKSAPRAELTGRRLALVAALLQILAVQLRIKSYGEISSRYMIIPLALSIPWAATGLIALLNIFAARLRTAGNVKSIDVRTLGVVVAALPMLYYLARPVNYDKAPYRQAGEWLYANAAADEPVLAGERLEQIMFYAGRTYPSRAWLPCADADSIDGIRAGLAQSRPWWFIDAAGSREKKIDEQRHARALTSGAIPELQSAWSNAGGGHLVQIFRVTDAAK